MCVPLARVLRGLVSHWRMARWWHRAFGDGLEGMNGNSWFRILSLDGGGIKGVFTASFLNSIEEMSGASIADYFDLITGTSTGGIIAVALGMGLPCGEILKFYRNRGPVIFPSTGAHRRFGQTVRRFVIGKHDHEVLATELRSVF